MYFDRHDEVQLQAPRLSIDASGSTHEHQVISLADLRVFCLLNEHHHHHHPILLEDT